jgi:hypothetical protein
LPDGGVPDDDEVPGLHEANRRRAVSRIEKARQHLIGDRVGEKLPAYVAAVEDAFVDGIALGGGKLGVNLNVLGFHRLPSHPERQHGHRTV